MGDYLIDYPKTIVMVSHARDVLNSVCTDIMHLKDQKLTCYKGDFDLFEKNYAEKLKNLERAHEKQDKEKAHTQQFIDRFRYNSKRAALVQSRIKALDRLPMLETMTSD